MTLALVESKTFEPHAIPPGVRIAVELKSPVRGLLKGYAEVNRQMPGVTMLERHLFAGKNAAICGAGPSLNDETIRGVDAIFACNSALPWLMRQGVPITAAVGIDQSPGLLKEWSDPPDVPYYVASTCDPALIAHLLAHGRTLRFFHNHVGFCESTQAEIDYYKYEWPTPNYMVGRGMTVVSRFVYVAFEWLACERVDLYGADCCLGPKDVAHADGTIATEAYVNPLILNGIINGRKFRSRPDMLEDAVSLVRLVRIANGRLRLMGDTLPVALLGKDDAFLNDVSRTIPAGEQIPAPDIVPSYPGEETSGVMSTTTPLGASHG